MAGKSIGPLFRGLTCCLLAFLILLGAAASQPVSAGEPEYVIKFSWVDPYNPSNPGAHFTSAYAATLQYQVNLLTSGRMRVDLFPAAQLGDHNSAAQQVANNTLEMANINIGNIATLFYPKLNVITAPFIYSSQEHARRVVNTQAPFMKKLYDEMAAESNIRVISLAPIAPRYITNSTRPITTPDDLKGLKIRTMEIVPHMVMMEALGASPVPIAFPELYTSLQTNVVDGQENQLMNIDQQKLYQVQKYISMTGHVIDLASNVISEKFFKSLPDDLRAALIEADRIAQMSLMGATNIFDSVGVANLEKQGMQVNYLPPEEIQKFKDISVPPVRKYLEEELGKEFVDGFMKSVEDARQSLLDESKVE